MSRSIVAAVAVAVAVAAAAGLAFYLLRPGASSTRAETADAVAPPPGSAAGPLMPVARPQLPVAPTPAPADPPPSAPAIDREGVTIGRGTTIATVNGVAITGADVLAFRADAGDSLQVSRGLYDYMTQRAIERELTLQAARARKLELNAADDAQLAQVRKNAEERGETNAAKIDFEEKEAKAQLLLEALAAAEGAPPAMPDDKAVDAYLAANAAEVGPVPSDPKAAQQQRVTIRQKLYNELTAAHHQFIRALLARLEAEARITH